MSKNALAAVKEEGSLVTIHTPEEIEETAAAVKEAIGERGMSPQDLARIVLPGGKSRSFILDDGDASETEIVGAVLMDSDIRIMYDKPFGGGDKLPPVCYSTDGKTGIGDPGGDCATCPNNQWGTRLNEKGESTRGKRCSERRLFILFCVQPHSTLPLVLSAPPSSLNAMRRDFMRAAGKGCRLSTSLWTFYLETSSAGGFDHPVVRARFERKLSKEELALVEVYRGAILGMEDKLAQAEE